MDASARLRSSSSTVVVVGASLAGLRACETLREEGYAGTVVLIGAEPHLPYDRPPLSKEILQGKWDAPRTTLRKQGLEDLQLDLRLGVRAESLDVGARRLRTSDGNAVAFDGLVVATGAAARALVRDRNDAAPTDLEGVHLLRTLDDALALRDDLARGPRVAVVGAGFIGAEVASSCRARGLDVVVVEPLAGPMYRVLGEVGAGVAAGLQRDNGVDLRCGVGVAGLLGPDGSGRVQGLRLSDGSRVAADVVVVGIGAAPQAAWLQGSGLTVDDGLVCDERCATAADGIVAAGDVARWFHVGLGRTTRAEHWTNASAQGRAAALRLLRGASGVQPYAPLPYVWSDQFGVKIQMVGHPGPGDDVHVVDGSLDDFRFVALYSQGDRLTAVLGLRRPRLVMEYQDLLERGVGLAEALAR